MTSIIAERGGIYKWTGGSKNPNATFTRCLVVSGDSRSEDAMISVLFLYDGHGKGLDCVDFSIDGEIFHVHAEMITYTARSLLLSKIMQISDDKMDKIDLIMRKAIGLDVEGSVYKELYDDLVGRMVKGA